MLNMSIFRASLFFGLVFALVVISSSVDVINSNLVVNNVDRYIDLSSQVTKVSYKFTIENTGKTPENNFIFALEADLKQYISFINVQTADHKQNLHITLTKIPGHDNVLLWRVNLRDSLQSGKTTVIEVDTFLTHYLTPYPAKITQKEKQYMLFNGNHYVFSPYKILKQTTTVVLGTRNVESYSKLKPTTQSDTNIIYGPYTNIAPFSVDKMKIHYENNSPFLTVTHLERVIEVSHWGNIAIEETIEMEHQGAELKGSFSRYEYQRESQSGLSSVKSFKTILPASASDAYYRDEIGNISTSHMRILSDSVELDLRPRFPLFGGWKTKYTLGYNVPSYEYLYNSGDTFVLKLRILDHVFDDMIVDELITKIILPEGAKNIEWHAAYPVTRLPDETHYTYLDSVGRKVIVLKKLNLIEAHIQDFELKYTFPKILMLQEPILAIGGFYFLFLLVIICVRLDFSITKTVDKKED